MKKLILVALLLLLIAPVAVSVPPSATLEDKIPTAFAGMFNDVANEPANTTNHKQRLLLIIDMSVNPGPYVSFYSRSLVIQNGDNDSTSAADVKSHCHGIFTNVVNAKVAAVAP